MNDVFKQIRNSYRGAWCRVLSPLLAPIPWLTFHGETGVVISSIALAMAITLVVISIHDLHLTYSMHRCFTKKHFVGPSKLVSLPRPDDEAWEQRHDAKRFGLVYECGVFMIEAGSVLFMGEPVNAPKEYAHLVSMCYAERLKTKRLLEAELKYLEC